MKIMGLDYGSVTVGVAISDSMLLTAQPVEVIKRKSENKLRQTLAPARATNGERRLWHVFRYWQRKMT